MRKWKGVEAYQDARLIIGIPAERCSAILNSGASHHYCLDNSKFKNLEPISNSIKLANGHTLPALGIGDVEITLPNGDK